MGQKVHPIGFRLGVSRDWDSRWYASKREFVGLLYEDMKVRKYITDRLPQAGIARIEIERAADRARVNLHTSRPGIVIGRKGADVDALKTELSAMTGKQVFVNIQEIKRPECVAQLVAENVGQQLSRRIAFRRAMKRAVESAMAGGCKGIKIACAGRLGGADMSRREWYRDGRVPLQTLNVNLDYGQVHAKTMSGVIGVKVWIYADEDVASRPALRRPRRGGRG